MPPALLSRSLIALATTCAISAAQAQDLFDGISASRIAIISDGDFAAGTYATGVLAPADAGYQDLLTVFSRVNGRFVSGSLPVSNSVTAPPEILELSPDGRTAFVVERLGQRPEGGQTVKDLPPGNKLFAIDLTDPAKPRLAAEATLSSFPESVTVSPDGQTIAVVSNDDKAATIQLVRFENGSFGEISAFNLADLGVTGSAEAPRGGVTATMVQWRPDGAKLAVNINTQNRVAFFDVNLNGEPGLKLWGQPVDVGTDPFVGRFTPDGRFYLTSNWGRDFTATSLDKRLPEAPSTVTAIQLADAEGEPVHRRVSDVESGISAEGIAVSPDGALVATVNMRGTALTPGTPRFDQNATVALLSLNPETGALRKLGEYEFEGVLPEGATFDTTGEHLLVTVFQGHAGSSERNGAGVEVYRVNREGEAATLESLGRIPMPHGAHHVDISG